MRGGAPGREELERGRKTIDASHATSCFPNRLGFDMTSAVPPVLRFDGLRVAIYPNDHRPAHVHVIGGASEAVFILNCPGGPVGLRQNYGFAGAALSTIEAALNEAVARLCEVWETIHGDH
jgi:hypothetical protein